MTLLYFMAYSGMVPFAISQNGHNQMFAVFGFLLLIAALIVHEAGHAIAMMRRGVEIKEAGVGIPLGKWSKLTIRSRHLPFPLIITPLIIGAYVQPTERGDKQLKQMGYKDRAVCYSAGVIMNLVFGGFLLLVLAVVESAQHQVLPSTYRVVLTLAFLIVPLAFRRVISMLLPLLGILSLVLTVMLIMSDPKAAGGPIEVVKLSVSSVGFEETMILGAALSLSLALFNMIPMVPLDGGHVMVALLERFRLKTLAEIFTVVTAIAFAAVFVLLVAKDLVSL